MTKQLYYHDAYQLEFDAKVIGRIEENQRVGVILDQTCFYPEGGGQPSDQGKLNQVWVYDVQKIDDNIVHFIDPDLKLDAVEGRIDGNRRHDFM
jgi:alanyl-tRNA synthetase